MKGMGFREKIFKKLNCVTDFALGALVESGHRQDMETWASQEKGADGGQEQQQVFWRKFGEPQSFSMISLRTLLQCQGLLWVELHSLKRC